MSMTVVPDFGYQQKNIVDQQNVFGWRLLYDYVRKSPKMIRLQHIIQDKVQEKKQKEINRLNKMRHKNNTSRNKNHAKQSTMVLPTSVQNDQQNGQNMGGSENRKASAGNVAEISRSLNIKTGGDYEQGGESKIGRKITRDLDNLVQHHESHQNYIDKVKKMNLDRHKGNKT